MLQPVAPCKDCKNRIVNCHSKCKLYLQYRKELDEYKEQIKQEKMLDVPTFGKMHKR